MTHVFKNYSLTVTDHQWSQEFEASKRLGFDVEMVDLKKDPTNGCIGTAIRFPKCAEFHPLM